MLSIKDCGLMVEPQEGMKVEQIVELARYAERQGYGYFFRSDHLLPTFNSSQMIDSPECWVSLAVLAASTQRIRFGSMVTPVGFRNPALLARMGCTLDSYSRGRMVMSLGAGWFEPEYIAHGINFPSFRVRRDQLIDALNIVRPLTEGKRVDYDGRHFSAHLECFPKPFNGKIRLVLGGRNPKILGAGSGFVDEVNIFSTPLDRFLKLKEIVREKNGKAEFSHNGSFVIARTQSELEERISRHMRFRGESPQNAKRMLQEKGVFCGYPDEVVAMIDERVKSGVSRIYFQILDPQDGAQTETLSETLREHYPSG